MQTAHFANPTNRGKMVDSIPKERLIIFKVGNNTSGYYITNAGDSQNNVLVPHLYVIYIIDIS